LSEKPHVASIRKPGARATLKDVAVLAGVGTKTASRVFNGVQTVNPELAERVRSAAAKMAYRPNIAAGNLRRGPGHSKTIGLLLSELATPHYAAIMSAVENEARQRGVVLLAAGFDDSPAIQRQMTENLIDRGIDGLLIAPTAEDHVHLLHEHEHGTPLVILDREPTVTGTFDTVVAASRRGAQDAIDHLVSFGHSRIGYVGMPLERGNNMQRFAGYCDGLQSAGLTVDHTLITHARADVGLEHLANAARAIAHQILSGIQPPTAIFASHALAAMGTMLALRDRGLQHRVAVVGFDDAPLASLLDPGLTVIAQDSQAMGRLAASRLFARIQGDDAQPSTHTIPTTLIPRGSGEIKP
jgi:LacI family transcriptional regulator